MGDSRCCAFVTDGSCTGALCRGNIDLSPGCHCSVMLIAGGMQRWTLSRLSRERVEWVPVMKEVLCQHQKRDREGEMLSRKT